MSDFVPRLPARPSLEQLQKQAKDLLRQYCAGDAAAQKRLGASGPKQVTLADAQFVLAREHGFETWAKLKHHLDARPQTRPDQYESLAKDLVSACQGDADALVRCNGVFGLSLTADVLRTKVQERLSAITGSPAGELTTNGAQLFIARQHGCESWTKLLAQTAPFYRINRQENTIEPGPVLSDKDWDTIVGVMKEHKITGLNANGRMTDAGLKRLAGFDQLTRLNLDGSIQLTDDGLAHLARLPQLQELDLSGYKGRITDKGLAVLRHLPELRRFQMCWQQKISDAGLANLALCEHLESVDLLGTPAGDGMIGSLTGKSKLRRFKTGRSVTDAGLALLHGFPAFKNWHGGEITYSLMSADAGPTHLLVDGPFTDAGLAKLAGLDGLFALTFFWHCPAFTSKGLAPLTDLPHLGFLGCQDNHCDDVAMHHIAAIPRLRMLMGQGAVATDAGFAALSRSKTIEYIWGRECPNLTGRGFAALSAMPALRGLAVSCKHVDDAALSALPSFPALREFMPMDVPDHGFRHVGQCEQLEALWCMYCRDTGDVATEHIKGLSKLKSYYAGASQITDRSLAILARINSLERLEFWQCLRVTDAGVAHLAGLPRLREINLHGLPGVTRERAAALPAHIHVNYSA